MDRRAAGTPHVIIVGVHVGRRLVAGREFEPEDEWFRFIRIAIQSRDLRPL